MKSLKFLLIGLLLTTLFLFRPQTTYGANFSTDYNVTYAVLENATTNVTFDVTLTNSTSQFYAASYKLVVGFTDIKNVSARDSTGPITPEITKVKEGTEISVTFNKNVVGVGNKQNFSVSFITNEISEHSGNVWEVNIPGISEQNDFSNFNVKVVPPKSAQNLLYIKPQINVANNANAITFNQNQLGNSGISIAYGDYQVYKFSLKYHFKNGNLFPVKTEAALPPSTNYQDIQIMSIMPEPTNLKKDIDGNWLAEFELAPREEVTATVKGYSKLYIKPRKSQLSQNEVSLYTRPNKYWESDSSEIKKIARTLKNPRQIYDFVANKLTYDFTRVQDEQVRLGAMSVLKNSNSAVCLEFTDLFIALARSAGIPARAVEGYANTQNSRERPLSLVEDILHAWPEYYDFEKEAWVMVDPTWANTTKGVDYFNVLDLDHFAFVIKGTSSEYPIPAGGYKQKGQETIKDVDVEAISTFPAVRKELSGDLEIAANQVSFLPITGHVVVKNSGNYPTDSQIVTLRSDLNPSKLDFTVPSLLPYQETELGFELNNKNIAINKSSQLKLETQGQVIVKSIKISLVPINWLVYILGGFILVIFIFVLSIVIYKSWRLYVLRRVEQSNLRGKSPKY